MRRLFLIFVLLAASINSFAQLNIPERIIGRVPDADNPNRFQIQVGAYTLDENVDKASMQLLDNALVSASERYQGLTRVMIKGIPANQVMNFLVVIKQAGFNEVIIREDAPATIAEKWEIDTPESAFASFEFNHDRNYIAVENNRDRSVYFGEYSIPQKDIIVLENLGTIVVSNSDDAGVNFTFTHVDEPDNEMQFTAAKAGAITESPEIDLLCRTWEVIDCTDTRYIGMILFISNAGTYFFTKPDGSLNNLSQWRWYSNDAFEYSHNDWENYGRVQILDLTVNSLEFHDPGYNSFIPGYSTGWLNNYWELVPVKN